MWWVDYQNAVICGILFSNQKLNLDIHGFLENAGIKFPAEQVNLKLY